MAESGSAGTGGPLPDEAGPGEEMPNHRQYLRYVEQHCADSLNEAVAPVEAWAVGVLAVPSAGPVCYPSAPWIARQLLSDLTQARRFIAAADAHKAAWYALRVGELIMDAQRHGFLDAPPDPPAPSL